MNNSMPSKGVGRSWRTPLKHEVMWQMVGQEAGVAPRLPGVKSLVWCDLTAGDAVPVDGVPWERSCSVGILAHHASLCTLPVRVALHEKNPNTYAELLRNLSSELGSRGWQNWSGDDATWTHGRSVVRAFLREGEKADLSGLIDRGTAVLVFNDPNNADGWAMRDGFAEEINETTGWFRTLSTLGCNVGGLKRIEAEKRARWFTFPEEIRQGTPAYRDMILAAVDRDDSQWAYLISTSVKWRKETEGFFIKAAWDMDRTVSMAWYRTQPEEFSVLTNRLFRTKKERGES